MKLFLAIIILSMGSVIALDVPQATDEYVNDFAQVLEPADAQTLRTYFQNAEEATGVQIVFVSRESIEGEEISAYALAIGETWGVGQNDYDNGIVMLYVSDEERFWVATGYGVEGVLPDSKIGRLLDDYYVPARDEGFVSTGIVQFSEALIQALEGETESVEPSFFARHKILIIIIAIVLIIIIIGSVRSRHSWGSSSAYIPHAGGGWSSGGGFGGGSFGGGGAGR